MQAIDIQQAKILKTTELPNEPLALSSSIYYEQESKFSKDRQSQGCLYEVISPILYDASEDDQQTLNEQIKTQWFTLTENLSLIADQSIFQVALIEDQTQGLKRIQKPFDGGISLEQLFAHLDAQNKVMPLPQALWLMHQILIKVNALRKSGLCLSPILPKSFYLSYQAYVDFNGFYESFHELQKLENLQIDEKQQLFELSQIFFQLLTKSPLANDQRQSIYQKLITPQPSYYQLPTGISIILAKTLVDESFEQEQATRFESIDAFLSDLSAYIEKEGLVADSSLMQVFLQSHFRLAMTHFDREAHRLKQLRKSQFSDQNDSQDEFFQDEDRTVVPLQPHKMSAQTIIPGVQDLVIPTDLLEAAMRDAQTLNMYPPKTATSEKKDQEKSNDDSSKDLFVEDNESLLSLPTPIPAHHYIVQTLPEVPASQPKNQSPSIDDQVETFLKNPKLRNLDTSKKATIDFIMDDGDDFNDVQITLNGVKPKKATPVATPISQADLQAQVQTQTQVDAQSTQNLSIPLNPNILNSPAEPYQSQEIFRTAEFVSMRESDEPIQVQTHIESVQPVIELVQTVIGPVQPVIEPVQTVIEAIQPVLEAIQPAIEAVQPAIEPVQPTIEPVQPTIEPVQPTIETIKPVSEPIQVVVAPVKSEPVKSEPVKYTPAQSENYDYQPIDIQQPSGSKRFILTIICLFVAAGAYLKYQTPSTTNTSIVTPQPLPTVLYAPKVKPTGFIKYQISTIPTGANVFLDGHFLAEKTPTEVSIEQDHQHQMILYLDGHIPVEIKKTPAQDEQFNVDLVPMRAPKVKLKLQIEPAHLSSQVEVSINGDLQPKGNLDLVAGYPQIVEVKHPKYQTKTIYLHPKPETDIVQKIHMSEMNEFIAPKSEIFLESAEKNTVFMMYSGFDRKKDTPLGKSLVMLDYKEQKFQLNEIMIFEGKREQAFPLEWTFKLKEGSYIFRLDTIRMSEAYFSLDGNAQFAISIDGKPMGKLPFIGKAPMSSGKHLISIQNEKENTAFEFEIDLYPFGEYLWNVRKIGKKWGIDHYAGFNRRGQE